MVEFFITDGTTYIDLLNHFRLAQWKPQAIPYKDGGVYQSSGISDWRRLVVRRYDNIVEKIMLIVKAGSQASAIHDLRRLRQILEKAADFQSGWQGEPVYLAARGVGDNRLRYALIVKGTVSEDPDPYNIPFVNNVTNSVAGVVELEIEHLAWQDCVPGQAALLGVTAYGYNGSVVTGTVMNSATAPFTPVVTKTMEREAFVVNKYTLGSITDVYQTTGGGASVSGNLIITGQFTDTNLFGTPLTVGDALYIGNVNPVGVSTKGTFNNVVFDLKTAASGFTSVWEYYNGAAWVTLGCDDETNELTKTGVRRVSFNQPSNWTITNIPGFIGLSGWWVRLRVTAITGAVTVPVQQNRNIYTTTWNWVQVYGEDISGDIPALAVWEISGRGTGVPPCRIIAGLRSTARGSGFFSFIPITDVTFNALSVTLTNVSFVDDTRAPTGRTAVYTAGASDGIIKVNIDNPDHFKGKYRCFIRYEQELASAGDFRVSLAVAGEFSAGALSPTYVVSRATESLSVWQLLDMGLLDVLTNYTADDTVAGRLEFNLKITPTAAAIAVSAKLKIYDIILIPCDEWMGDIVAPQYGYITGNTQLVIDGVRDVKQITRAYTSYYNTPLGLDGTIREFWTAVTNHYPILQLGDQRLYMVIIYDASGAEAAFPHNMVSVRVYAVNRYQTMTGEY